MGAERLTPDNVSVEDKAKRGGAQVWQGHRGRALAQPPGAGDYRIETCRVNRCYPGEEGLGPREGNDS